MLSSLIGLHLCGFRVIAIEPVIAFTPDQIDAICSSRQQASATTMDLLYSRLHPAWAVGQAL